MSTIVEQITSDRMIALTERDTATYKILTRILGDYQTGATMKKPKVGDGAIIEILRDIIGGNTKSIEAMRERNADGEYNDKILTLEIQSEMLGHYLPVLLTEDELREILRNQDFTNIGAFQQYLRTNFPNRFQPGVAAQVFNEGV